MTPSKIIGTASSAMHPIGTALADCATHMSAIRELLPARGELVDEYRDLVTSLAWIEATYRDADEALTAAYVHLEHAERAAREGWTPIPLQVNGNGAGG